MAKITPDQLRAADAVLRSYLPDSTISLSSVFLEALDAFEQAGPKKRTKLTKGATRLPEGIPDAEHRQNAHGFWTGCGRGDLCLKMDLIAEEFRSYHLARGSMMESWGHAWATWYRRQPEFHKPSGQLELVVAAYEETTSSGWTRRLETFFGLLESPKWTWRKSWGPNPFEDDHKVPASVRAEFKARNPSLITKKVFEEWQKFSAKTS